MARAYLLTWIVLVGAGVMAAYLASDGPPSAVALIGYGSGAIIAFVMLVVLVTYGVSRVHASPAPPEFRAGGIAILASMLRESLAHLVVFGALAPLEKLWTRDDHPRASTRTNPPILLVHGYLLNGAAWWRFARLLEKAGFQTFVVTLAPPLGSIDAMADSLGRRIETICATTGARQVQLVAHSMGGLVCRAYLRACGVARVARFVTVASPHHGTALARLGVGQSAREMTPGSAWLAALAEWESLAEHPPTLALFSYYDNYITPQMSAMLPWARNERLPPLGHVEMYFSRRVVAQVCDGLEARAA